jgi:hypothetical protein
MNIDFNDRPWLHVPVIVYDNAAEGLIFKPPVHLLKKPAKNYNGTMPKINIKKHPSQTND